MCPETHTTTRPGSRKKPSRRHPDRQSGRPASDSNHNSSSVSGRLREVMAHHSWWVSLALVAITAIAYAPVRSLPFLGGDDQLYITGNDFVRNGLTWHALKWAVTTATSPYWHPLTWVSH